MFGDEYHGPFEITWEVYQRVIDAYQAPDPVEGKQIMEALIDTIKTGVPAGLEEVRTLGRTLQRRRDDILAFFDHPRTSNGPTEAINGHYRTKQTHHQRPPQPHQLPAPNAPHHRRPRYLHPHPTLKSPFT